MNYELNERINEAEYVLIPKGENRTAVTAALSTQGIAVADIDGVNPRCLHGRRR
jgi:hypothetical protein